jgi:tetratricopeptide (TPR) repeat protein
MSRIRRNPQHPLLRPACILAGSALGALLLTPRPALPDMPADTAAALQAKYSCPKTKNDVDKDRIATSLSTQTSDKNALACAADMRYELTTASPSNLNIRVAALESLSSYIDLVLSLKRFDLIRVRWAESNLRLEHAGELASALLPATRAAWPNEPATIILTAKIEISLAGPNNPQVIIADISEVQRAIAIAPDTLHGEGQLLIGRKYLDLPPLFGGRTEKAVPFLERARDIAPDDPRALRYLAEAYDELGNREAALACLRALAVVTPRSNDFQLYADEWRMGEGLAARMGDPTLSDKFAALRADLMHLHSNLLLRKVATVFGHGGDDPMTGEPQYRGEQTNTH